MDYNTISARLLTKLHPSSNSSVLRQPLTGDASTKYVKIKPMKLFMPHTRLLSSPFDTTSPKVNNSNRADVNKVYDNSPSDNSYSPQKRVEGIVGNGFKAFKY
jgi:hypothetical protein